MSRSDDAPVKIMYPDYRPAHASEMGEFLMKIALGEDELETNEDKSTAGAANLHPDPGEGKDLHDEPGVHQVAGRDEAFHSSDRVFEESVDVRRGILEREFSNFKPTQGTEAAMMAKNFAHVRSGDFQSHSALLQPKTKTGSAAEQAINGLSLAARVQKICG